MIMQDQGFDDMEDLLELTKDDSALADLVPAMGHRSKLKRLLTAHATSQSATNPQSAPRATVPALRPPPPTPQVSTAGAPAAIPVPRSLAAAAGCSGPLTHHASSAAGPSIITSSSQKAPTGVSATPPDPAPIRLTPAVQWLCDHDLPMYAASVQKHGLTSFLDLTSLLSKPDLFHIIIPSLAHRNQMAKLLIAEAAAIPSHPISWLREVRSPTEDDLRSKDDREESGSHTSEPASILSTLATQVDPKFLRAGGKSSVRRVVADPAIAAIATAKQPPLLVAESRPLARVSSRDSSEPHRVPFVENDSDEDRRSHPVASRERAFNVGNGPEHVPAAAPNFVTVAGRRIDVILFEDNAALSDAMRSGSGAVCNNPRCTDFRDCNLLHFRTAVTRYEGRTLTISCCYVDVVTSGLISYLNRKAERVLICFDSPNCNLHERCSGLHMVVPVCGRTIPLASLSVTFPLIRILENRTVDKKADANLRICQSFSLSQLCLQGSGCRNIHVLPDGGFNKSFFAECREHHFSKHLRSLQHLEHERYDLGKYFVRANRPGLELGEAMDHLLWTRCNVCRNLLFDLFRRRSRRTGYNVLWAVATRMLTCGDEDPQLVAMIKATNSALALTQDKMITFTTPLHDLIQTIQEAIADRVRDRLAKFGGAVKPTDNFAHVFWDFDNVLIPDRAELLLFFSALTTYLCTEKIATSRNCITAKAFGTQHSLDNDAVDTLRDMQVETVLCSSKKSEETDRQLERSTRALHSKQNTTAVILSSDKDFMITAKELARSGVPVVTVHSAEKHSSHEAVLHHGSLHAVSVFEVYVSMLKSSCITRPANPWSQRRDDDRPAAAAASSSTLRSNLVRGMTQSHHADPAGSDSESEDEREHIVTRVDVPPGLRKPGSSAPQQATFGLAALVAPPKPPAHHKVWYQVMVEAYLLRLLDRHRLGEKCGVFEPRASESDALDHAEVFFDMGMLIPNFLPPGFTSAEALKCCAPRLLDTPSDDWLSVEYIASFATAQNAQHILQLFRHVGNVVDGPLETMIDPSNLGKVQLLCSK